MQPLLLSSSHLGWLFLKKDPCFPALGNQVFSQSENREHFLGPLFQMKNDDPGQRRAPGVGSTG